MKWMITLMLVWLIAVPRVGRASGILGNGSTSEDSIGVSVHLTDSLGNPSGTQADSFYVCVLGPSGDSILTTAGTAGSADLHIDSVFTSMIGWRYIYAEAIGEIDGSGRPGRYELTFCAKDNNPEYVNCRVCSFQLVGSSLDGRLAQIGTTFDSLLAVLDTLRNQDDWVSSFDPGGDTVSADLVKISGDSATADNLEAILDNTGGVRIKLSRVEISGANGTDQSLNVLNSSGPAVLFSSSGSGASDNGFEVMSLNGAGFFAGSINSVGLKAQSTNSYDMTGDITGTIIAGDTTAGGKTLAVMPGHWSAADSTAYQGEGSSLTVGDIADGVWDEAQAAHAGAGTFGYYLDAPVSAAGSPLGAGSYPVGITAYDSSTGQVVPGTRVSVHNIDMSALLAIGATAINGEITFNLDPDSCLLSATAPGYIFSANDTLIVSGAVFDTIFGYHFDPGSPASADLCRVYGFIYDIGGEPIKDVQVTAHISSGAVRHNSTIISPYKQTTLSDSTGCFYLDLIPSADLTPMGTEYLISATYPAGTVLKKKITVPDIAEWQLSW